MTDRDILLFSYGTLQLESVQLSSFRRRLDGEPHEVRRRASSHLATLQTLLRIERVVQVEARKVHSLFEHTVGGVVQVRQRNGFRRRS